MVDATDLDGRGHALARLCSNTSVRCTPLRASSTLVVVVRGEEGTPKNVIAAVVVLDSIVVSRLWRVADAAHGHPTPFHELKFLGPVGGFVVTRSRALPPPP